MVAFLPERVWLTLTESHVSELLSRFLDCRNVRVRAFPSPEPGEVAAPISVANSFFRGNLAADSACSEKFSVIRADVPLSPCSGLSALFRCRKRFRSWQMNRFL
jgi:hypothetical protein